MNRACFIGKLFGLPMLPALAATAPVPLALGERKVTLLVDTPNSQHALAHTFEGGASSMSQQHAYADLVKAGYCQLFPGA